MSLLKRAGDLVYTFRFLKLLVTSFENTDAYKLGIIDGSGKKLKSAETAEEKAVYTPFHRLVYNIKKLIPGGKIGSYASALYLIKEQFNVSENKIEEALQKVGIDPLDFLAEQSQWFVLEDRRLSPGSYKLACDKVLNDTLDDVVKKNDYVRVNEDCYPIGDVFGIDVYRVQHSRTKKDVYVTTSEILR